MAGKELTAYQRQFIESRGGDPDNPVTKEFALSGGVPTNAEDAGHRHLLGSSSYALDVVTPLKEGDLGKAKSELETLRKKVQDGETLAYEALMKLLALDIIPDTFEGEIVSHPEKAYDEAYAKLQELMSTPRPE